MIYYETLRFKTKRPDAGWWEANPIRPKRAIQFRVTGFFCAPGNGYTIRFKRGTRILAEVESTAVSNVHEIIPADWHFEAHEEMTAEIFVWKKTTEDPFVIVRHETMEVRP